MQLPVLNEKQAERILGLVRSGQQVAHVSVQASGVAVCRDHDPCSGVHGEVVAYVSVSGLVMYYPERTSEPVRPTWLYDHQTQVMGAAA